MARLSVNVNKIATLRNARGKNVPNLSQVVRNLISFGVTSITVHPRPDGRHILYQDVKDIKGILDNHLEVELNVEGYPDQSFLQLIESVKPNQCTLVPDAPDALTSNAGWKLKENVHQLTEHVLFLKKLCVRSSLFVDPFTLEEHENALHTIQPDRVELYTEAYADAWPTVQRETVTAAYIRAAELLKNLKIEINAGHDLNLDNLAYFLQRVPGVSEVSIGHALICESLYHGLEKVVTMYLNICHSSKRTMD